MKQINHKKLTHGLLNELYDRASQDLRDRIADVTGQIAALPNGMTTFREGDLQHAYLVGREDALSSTPSNGGTHTPTPYSWGIDDNGFPGLCIYFNDGRVCQLCETADIDDESKATAAFIVRACNAGQPSNGNERGLREALESILPLVENDPNLDEDALELAAKARAVLAGSPVAPDVDHIADGIEAAQDGHETQL